MSNSGKSAVGPAEQPSVVNQLLPERSQRFVHESWRAHRSCDRLIPANQPYSTIFSSVFSCQQCCQPRANLFFHAQIPAHHHHQSTPNASDTSDPAPSVPFHHSAILASRAYTSSTRFVRFDARSRVLSFLVLHSVSLGLRSSSHRDRVTGGRRCMARFQSGVLFDALVAPIFLCPLSFRDPRIVRRHVLLSSR